MPQSDDEQGNNKLRPYATCTKKFCVSQPIFVTGNEKVKVKTCQKHHEGGDLVI